MLGNPRPSLVFLHGLLGSSREFVPYLKHFAGHYPSYALDAPMHGDRHAPVTLTATSIVADLKEQLRQIPSPYLLVGHSLGGLVALRYAAQHPEQVVGVVTLDILPYYTSAFPKQYDFHNALHHLFSSPLHPADSHGSGATVSPYYLSLKKYLRGHTPENHEALLESVGEFVRHELCHLLQPSFLDRPVCFLVGESSSFTEGTSELWQTEYPQAKRVVVPEADHMLHLTQRPEVIEALEVWLAGLCAEPLM